MSLKIDFQHRIVLTGGGTGGHIYPALSVAEKLKEDPAVAAILYIGAAGHIEERLAREHNLDFVGLSVSGLPRKLSLDLLTWPIEFIKAVSRANKILADFRPTIILGTGGYASAAPLAAALLTGRPFAIHEPDAHPGLVNRLYAPHARLVSLGMAGASDQIGAVKGQIVVNGNPVSARFINLPPRSVALASLGLDPLRKAILITGGSQGAQAVNQAVYQALPQILNSKHNLQVLHQVGEKNWDELAANVPADLLNSPFYKPRKYFDDLEYAYAASDLTVCRAGAMTIAELAVTGTPAIFVPFPFAAQDHQTFNARFVESLGAARVLPQTELTAQRLMELIDELLSDPQKLDMMRANMRTLAKPNAAGDLAAQIKGKIH
jgi:UDP-N-acetylglucosamine--N-acetylmuramyl-(pentapeptide) pyrophosphoryl-undecaprenol N-acetylglucosamine transferase